jgi:hypothetical protein
LYIFCIYIIEIRTVIQSDRDGLLIYDLQRVTWKMYGYGLSLAYPNLNNMAAEGSFPHFCQELGDCDRANSLLKRKYKSNFPHWFSPELRTCQVKENFPTRDLELVLLMKIITLSEMS